jgi:sigma-B regulation protein RsbU (phosphoserine phosphatase)
MMTAFVGVLDFETHTMSYASAAHNPPWLIRSTPEGFKHTSLIALGTRLGESPKVEQPYEVKTVSFAKDDTLFMYTDGLLDGKNKDGQTYGKKQVRKVIEDGLTKDAQTVIATLMADFLAFNAGKKLDDDVTIGVVRVLS